MLNDLVNEGYFNTKSEAIRNGILSIHRSLIKQNKDDESVFFKSVARKSMLKDWKDEPDGLWESHLTKEELNAFKRIHKF